MPAHIDVHISFLNRQSVISFLNELELISSHAITAIISTQLNGFNNCYLTLIILLNITHSFVNNLMVPSIVIYHYLFN